jgi:hypothetical protein
MMMFGMSASQEQHSFVQYDYFYDAEMMESWNGE